MNWDPMAEDYKKNFNVNDDEDPLCLYVQRIPAKFTEEEFLSLMKDGGRPITSVMLNKKNITTDYTYGFVYFETHEDALLTRNELNQSPPLYLQLKFARKRKVTDREPKEYQKNISRGRGIRLDIEGQRSISQKLKVTTGGSGRVVTVASPEKKSNESSGLKSPSQPVEKSKAFLAEVSPRKSYIQKSDVPAALTPNCFCNCFCCGKRAELACVTCKKPYCSASCQSSDWNTHKRHCKQIKETADLLIKAYRSHTEALDSSYLSESSNSDFEKSQEYSDVKKLSILPGVFEKVSVTNINNPSKFWVHLEKFSGDFSKVERELASLQKHSPLKNISCRDNSLCCAMYKNKVYRGRILKEESRNEATVYLLDYGETVTTQKSDLFSLPEKLRKLPAQAVCCKLVDEAMKKDIDWNAEDILSFQLHAANKTYKAHILRCANDIYEVSLINEDGISVFSILAEAKKTVPCVSESLVSANDGVPPSVWSKLKPKTEVKLKPLVLTENDIWCYLLINEDLDMAEIIETEELMKNYTGEDISLCVEEGEFAAGFSEEFQQFFRCVVLKRKRSSFSVRYIDYGNEEEITRVSSLSEKLIKKCSYIVKCVKPTSISVKELVEVLGNSGIVKKISSDIAELVFNFQGEHILFCHQCYPCIQEVDSGSKNSASSGSLKGSSLKQSIKNQDNNKKSKASLKFKKIPIGITIHVKICFGDAQFVYVHQAEDLEALNELGTQLKSLSKVSISGMPAVGDVYCGLFTDRSWYRISIEEKISSDTYKVYYLDYGNYGELSVKDLRELPNDLFALPVYCIPVIIQNRKNFTPSTEEIYNVKTVSNNGEALEVILLEDSLQCKEEAKLPHISSLKKKQLKNGLNEVKIVHATDQGVYYCQLFSDNDDVLTIFKTLQTCPKEKCPAELSVGDVICAQSSDSFWYRASVLAIRNPSLKVFFLDYGNIEKVTSDCIKFLPKELLEQPTFAIPMRIENLQEIQNPEDLTKPLTVEKIKLLDENLHIVKVCLETESTAPEISKVELLSTEKFKEISEIEPSNKMSNSVEKSKRVTYDLCKSVPFNSGEQDIVIYSTDEDGLVFCAPFIKENIEANILLPQTLTEHCNQHGISFNDGSEPQQLEMVLALYPEDNQWYRGTIVDKLDGSYFVNFVDYGNTEQLDLSSLRKMEEQFMELDMQAHMCTLTGFSIPNENRQRVCEELKNFTIFSYTEPLRAVVEVKDNDITLTIPKIISHLVEKQLVTRS